MRINAVGVSDAHVVGYGTAAGCLWDAASGYRTLRYSLEARDYELLTSIISDTIPTFGSN